MPKLLQDLREIQLPDTAGWFEVVGGVLLCGLIIVAFLLDCLCPED
jgi:hypothetical protein